MNYKISNINNNPDVNSFNTNDYSFGYDNNYNENYNENYDNYGNVYGNNIQYNNVGYESNVYNNISFNHFGMTDMGKVSKINEDYLEGFTLLDGELLCLTIADGLGSVHGGQISSVVVIDELKNYLIKYVTSTDNEHLQDILNKALYSINRIIYNYQRINPEVYGSFTSTITIAIINKKREMVMAHIGNSRLYLLRGDTINQLTSDDTFAMELVKQGKITSEEYKVHPDRNKLNNYLGSPNFNPFIGSGSLMKEDLVLLCTNGLFEMLNDEYIKAIMYETGNSKDACEKLIHDANELGGIDNIGIIISYIDF